MLSMAASSKSTDSSALIKSLLSHESICDYDAVVLVDQPGVSGPPVPVITSAERLRRSFTQQTCE